MLSRSWHELSCWIRIVMDLKVACRATGGPFSHSILSSGCLVRSVELRAGVLSSDKYNCSSMVTCTGNHAQHIPQTSGHARTARTGQLDSQDLLSLAGEKDA